MLELTFWSGCKRRNSEEKQENEMYVINVWKVWKVRETFKLLRVQVKRAQHLNATFCNIADNEASSSQSDI